MATEEQKLLSSFLKEVHSDLRKSTSRMGAEKAWQEHCKKTDVLKTYAEYMETLATTHWERNSADDHKDATSRIEWTAKLCFSYFVDKSYVDFRKKEDIIAKKINVSINETESFSEPLKLIDVGSCYNPFKSYNFFDVLAIDLCPANESVYFCDFINVDTGVETIIDNNHVVQIKENNFEIVTFCFLLEYIPSSEMRINVCEKAYRILKLGGLLVITTPDSKHVGANSKIMKCWRYALALMGFTRIKYEKLRHMHCMAFRKSVKKELAVRWSELHQESYMDYAIHIPQDYNTNDENTGADNHEIEVQWETTDFDELPFCIRHN